MTTRAGLPQGSGGPEGTRRGQGRLKLVVQLRRRSRLGGRKSTADKAGPGERGGTGQESCVPKANRRSACSLAGSGCRSREVCRAAGCVGSPASSVLLGESANPFSNSYSIAITSFSILKDQCRHSVFYFTLI